MHLDGGITDDTVWQTYWRCLIVYTPKAYDVLRGAVGRHFLLTLIDLLDGVRLRKWNAERFIVFQLVILQRTRAVNRAKDIKHRLSWRLDAWDAGQFDMLVQATVQDMRTYLAAQQGGTTAEQRAKVFQRKMLRGNVRGAVKYLTATQMGSVLLPDHIDEKTGSSVTEILQSKHPGARTLEGSMLPSYDTLPDFVTLDITERVVEVVAR